MTRDGQQFLLAEPVEESTVWSSFLRTGERGCANACPRLPARDNGATIAPQLTGSLMFSNDPYCGFVDLFLPPLRDSKLHVE